jgi:hypothetical protein
MYKCLLNSNKGLGSISITAIEGLLTDAACVLGNANEALPKLVIFKKFLLCIANFL